ncbi:hypothetical protein PMG11_08437 [Penicillium brasilianum]|uniref:SnoaL-like domain-containing protein n=1 Tax=Penicillium brasilianum TaxID=104259 RepID=A0A0F7TT16_PENBI|nr:hypothetical protein PMG11_08437 [Penicillium brasilianum]
MISTVIFVGSLLSCLLSRGVTAFDKRVEGINTNHIKTFDCPSTTQAHPSQRELRASMDRFASIFYVEKDVESAFDQYVAKNYVQHNPGIADGRDAAVEALTPLFSAKENYFQIARVMVGPEYTTIHIKASTKIQASNVFDVYRTIGSCTIEH